jgi:hypothetical protein
MEALFTSEIATMVAVKEANKPYLHDNSGKTCFYCGKPWQRGGELVHIGGHGDHCFICPDCLREG